MKCNDNKNEGPFNPEDSDGCTIISKPYAWITGKPLPFRSCCIAHDKDYWYGGTRDMRRSSDLKLRDCVYAHHNGTNISKVLYWIISRIMYVGVFIGGHPDLPLPWRWHYSKPYSQCGYAKESNK